MDDVTLDQSALTQGLLNVEMLLAACSVGTIFF